MNSLHIREKLVILVMAVCLCLVSHHSFSQSLNKVRSIINGDKVEIRYDLLEAPSPEATYEVLIFSNVNQLTTPLQRVTGDVGKEITPGLDKLIIWDPRSELTRFIGEVYFEVRVNITMPYLSFTNPVQGAAFKRGKTSIVKWGGGSPTEKLQVELYQNNARIRTLQSIDNTGEFNWAVPIDLKPTKNYQLKVTSLTNNDNFSFTHAFMIKRKVPLLLKFLPLALIGALVPLLGGGGGGGDPIIITPPSDPIPNPPDPN